MKFRHEILETLGYHVVKTEVSIYISPGLETVPDCDGQTDEQTDGQTDGITIAITR